MEVSFASSTFSHFELPCCLELVFEKTQELEAFPVLKEVFGELPAAGFVQRFLRLRTKTWSESVYRDRETNMNNCGWRTQMSCHLGARVYTSTLFVEWLAKAVNVSQVFALGSFELSIPLPSQNSTMELS